MNGMMTGDLLDGMKVWKQTFDNSAGSFSLGSFDLGAMSCPKRFKGVKMNMDTGAAVNTFPLNFGSDGVGDGRFHRTACGVSVSLMSISERKTHWLAQSVVQCRRNCVQRTTRFLRGTQCTANLATQ